MKDEHAFTILVIWQNHTHLINIIGEMIVFSLMANRLAAITKTKWRAKIFVLI